MAAALALFLLLAPASLEERFIAALRSDLATGTAAETAGYIAPSIRDKLTPARLAPVYRQWQANGKILSLATDPTTPFAAGTRVRLILRQEKAETHVVCTFDDEGRLVGYWFRPAPPKWGEEKTDAVMDAWSGDFAWCVADPDGLVSGERGDGPFPLGSIFKLYVLAELARQLDEGTLRADRKVKIREEWKSFPSGVLHARPAGTEVTVDELATKMIAISDNTATDHLIHLLGRENIERRLARWHNSCPERNIPFLTTREMFLMKGGGKESEVDLTFRQLCDRWPAADRATRMGWVKGMTAPFDKLTIATMLPWIPTGYAIRSTAVGGHLTFEWHAEPSDVCALLLAAWKGEIAGKEHFLKYYAKGSEIYPREWVEYYGFKGGSETNVMAMCALAVSKKGRPVAVCVCRRGKLNPAAAGDVAQVAAALLRRELERELAGEVR